MIFAYTPENQYMVYLSHRLSCITHLLKLLAANSVTQSFLLFCNSWIWGLYEKHSTAACQRRLKVRWGLDLTVPLNGRSWSLRGWEEGVFDSSSFWSSMKSWICFWGRISFCSFSCRCGMERTLSQWLPTGFSNSAASQGNPCSAAPKLSMPGEEALSIFVPLLSSRGTGVASSCPCWSPRGLTAGSLLGAFSEVISHSTPLASPSHPYAWLHSCLSGSSCLCAVQRLSFSRLSTLSLSVGGSWLWRAPAALLLPRAGFSRAHLWSQVVCGWKNWSCWIFGFAPKKTYLPWDLLLKN